MSHGILHDDTGYTVGRTWHALKNYGLVEFIGVPEVEETFDYEILRVPVFAGLLDGIDADGEAIYRHVAVPDKMALVNSRTERTIGMHSPKYGENQPKETFPELAQVLIDHGFEIVSVGTISGSAKMFMSAKMPDDFSFDFGGKQIVQSIINIGDAVDGSSTFRIAQALHRIECANTFSAYLVGVEPMVRVKHTRSGQVEVANVGEALDNALTEQKAINEAVERMIEASFTEAQFMEMVRDKTLLGAQPTEDGNAKTRWGNEFDKIVAAYNEPNLDGIRETQFGALNAIQFYETNAKSVRGAAREERFLDNLVFKTQAMSHAAADLILAN